MNDPRVPKLVVFLLLALGFLQWAHVYPQLPDVMAAHFAANGFRPHPEIHVQNQSLVRVPFGVAAALGTMWTVVAR